MAQTRYFEFQADDTTISLDQWLLGLIESGLYRGYDFTATNNLNLTLTQATTGYPAVNGAGSPETLGIIVTRQGVVIKETENILLPISGTDALPRIDLVICTHTYVATAGGESATYSIVQGTPAADPVAPANPTPNTSVVLGELYLPIGTTTLDQAGVIYTKAERPNFAGKGISISSPNDSLSVTSNEGVNSTTINLDANTIILDSGSWDEVNVTGTYFGAITNYPASLNSGTNQHYGTVEVQAGQLEIETGENFWHVKQTFTSFLNKEVFVRHLQGNNSGSGLPVTVTPEIDSNYTDEQAGRDANGWLKVGYPRLSFAQEFDYRAAVTVQRKLNGSLDAILPKELLGTRPIALDGFVVTKVEDAPTVGQAEFTWTGGSVYHQGQVFDIPASVSPLVGVNADYLRFTKSGSGDTTTITLDLNTSGGNFTHLDIRNWNTSWTTISTPTDFGIFNSQTPSWRISNGNIIFKGAFTLPPLAGSITLFTLPLQSRPNNNRFSVFPSTQYASNTLIVGNTNNQVIRVDVNTGVVTLQHSSDDAISLTDISPIPLI